MGFRVSRSRRADGAAAIFGHLLVIVAQQTGKPHGRDQYLDLYTENCLTICGLALELESSEW